jgi:hypothetical protein
MITWQQDGKTVLSGVGKDTFSFTTGATGVTTRVRATIHSASRGDFSKDFTFVPSNIHLLWEADTSVPPLYRGKALYSPGSKLTIVALAKVVSGGASISPSRLSYQWQVGNEPAPSASGVGRYIFTYYGNQLNQGENITVTVSYAGNPVGSARVNIPAVNPSILFYVQDPLRGLRLDQALPSAFTLAGQEVTLHAQPFYFANESLGKSITYKWTLNGQTISTSDTDNGSLTLRQNGAGQGQSIVSLKLQNTDNYKFLQEAESALNIVFGNPSATAPSTFGL